MISSMRISKILKIVLESEEIPAGNKIVSRHFVSKKEIRRLNKERRYLDELTDVLSFPQFNNIKEILAAEKTYANPKIFLGDIIICKSIARKQASESD